MVSAGCSHSFANLRVRVDCVARLLGSRFGNDLHRVDVAIKHWCRAGKTRIEEVLLQHLIKRSKCTTLVRVIVKHLLLRNCSQRFDSRRLICRAYSRPPSRHTGGAAGKGRFVTKVTTSSLVRSFDIYHLVISAERERLIRRMLLSPQMAK